MLLRRSPVFATMRWKGVPWMLPTLLRELFQQLEFFSSYRAPQLLIGLAVCGFLLILLPDDRPAILAFLAQRLMALALLWSAVPVPLGTTSVIASTAIAVIYVVTELRLFLAARGKALADGRGAARISLPFGALAAALGQLVTYGALHTWVADLLPVVVAFPAILLAVNGFLVLLLANNAGRIGLGILTFSDACRVLYALWQPNLLVWGLWSACDVLVALSASHLHSAEVATLRAEAGGGAT